MATDIKGFLKVKRSVAGYRPACERVKDYSQAALLKADNICRQQGSRCMDCSTSFCHWGCPVGNYIPEWNELMSAGHWQKAFELLNASNNLPEITGRLCPALCEYACVLGINDEPVTIRENELGIIEYAFKNGLIKAHPPKKRSGKKIAVVGSGPAGLSCAAELNRSGHKVTVFEKDERIGGILRYGIPDFKLEKRVIDRRLKIWEEEGIVFKTGVNAGVDYPAERLLIDFDAVCLCGGSRKPRDLKIPGRNLQGIHFAMDYLIQSNKRVAKTQIKPEELIDAKDKKVLVIGGGDTGADCVGTAHRQGASCVAQIEVLPKPSEKRTSDQPWPKYPAVLRISSSHEEGGERQWSVLTREFLGKDGQVKGVSCIKLDHQMKEVSGSEFLIEADLVILAIGFLHPEHEGLLSGLKLQFDSRGNVLADADYKTSVGRVFAAGDMRRGQSLIVWAIAEGRKAAESIDRYLTSPE